MIQYCKQYQIIPEWEDREWVIAKGEAALQRAAFHITDARAPLSEGGIHDYYSNGDYWWPNPDTPDGLPYIQRDGESNPGNFNEHRKALRGMRTDVVFLTASCMLTGQERFALRAVECLQEFFLAEETRMNPHLNYAQALPGICAGRGIGVIDTLHLADVVFAIHQLNSLGQMEERIYRRLQDWFAQYLGWMLTSRNGMAEMNTTNNHSVCFFVQAAAFALFTENERIGEFCRQAYKNVLLKQMAADGSFPRELGRTKPYNYSIFVLDNMVSLCQMLSTPEDDLWNYSLPDGRCIQKGLSFLVPYVLDKSAWPYPPDVMHFEAFPARTSFMMFAGCRLGMAELLAFYRSLPVESMDEEARRNIAVRLPYLWM